MWWLLSINKFGTITERSLDTDCQAIAWNEVKKVANANSVMISSQKRVAEKFTIDLVDLGELVMSIWAERRSATAH